MSDHDVVEVYRAKTGFHAGQCVTALEEAGIRARIQGEILHPAVETGANLGTGVAAWWEAPRILVRADDAETATRILLDLEERERSKTAETPAGPPIDVVWHKCGQRSTYPAKQRGSVRDCPHCGAYVDVESDDGRQDTERRE
jgi:hypothetical protein